MAFRLAGIAAVIVAAILWGTTGTIQTLLPPESNPLAVGALRLLIGAAVLWLLALSRPESRRAFARVPWRIVAVAGTAIAAFNMLFFRAVLEAGVGVGTAIAIGSAPVWTTGFEVVAGKGLPSGLRVAGQAVSIAGVAVLGLAGADEDGTMAGGISAMLAGASYAVYSLATVRVGEAVPSATAAAATIGVGALLTLPVLVIIPPVWLSGIEPWIGILFLGIGTTTIAYALYTWGLGRIAASTAVTLVLVEPVTAWLLATFIVGEVVTLTRLVGASLILVGLALVAMVPSRRKLGHVQPDPEEDALCRSRGI